MITIEYDFSVPRYKRSEIGYHTLVRGKRAEFEFRMTNDSNRSLDNLSVAITLESYIGQDTPKLFRKQDPVTVDKIPHKSMVPLNCVLYPTFPGLIAVSVYVTDSVNNAIQIKKSGEKSYQVDSIRWWFHVVDDISIDILRTLKQLLTEGRKK